MNFRCLTPLVLLAAAAMTGCGATSASSSGSSSSSSSTSSSSSSTSSSSSSSSSASSGQIEFQPAQLDTGTWYAISGSQSDLVLGIEEGSPDPGAALVQQEPAASYHQQFRFIDAGNDTWRLAVRHSGMVLDVYEFNENDGADIVQWEDLNGENQQFMVQQSGNGTYRFVNRMSAKALVPENSSAEPLIRMTQASPSADPAQQWRLEEVEDVSGPDTGAMVPSTWNLSGNLGTHDPTLIKENGTWWVFQTGRGIYGKRSADGLNWEPLASIFENPLSWWNTHVPDHADNDVWAPDVIAFNGRVWMYYSISTFGARISAIGLVSATSIAAGDWRDEGMVIATGNSHSYNAIDPDLIITPTGEPWMVFGSWNDGIMLTAIDPGTMKPTGTLYNLASRSGGIEGPTLIHRNGFYYLFTSVGRCCAGTDSTYQIMVGRSAQITGPYLDRNGVALRSGGGTVVKQSAGNWIGPGGQDVHDGVIAYHAYDASQDGAPLLRIETLGWDDQGWPYLP